MGVRKLVILLVSGALACGYADDRTREQKSDRKTRVRLGGITVGAAYSRYSGFPWYGYPYLPAWYPYWSPYWSPFWDAYLPLYHPGYAPGYYLREGPGMGEVKLEAPAKSEVYLDGAYAGLSNDLKTIWLKPGAYDLEVRGPGRPPFTKRIYVLSGKRLKIEAAEEKP